MSLAEDIGSLYLNKKVNVMISVEKNTFKYSDYELSDNYILTGVITNTLSDSVVLKMNIGDVLVHCFSIVAISEYETDLKTIFAFKRNSGKDS
jgi:hypothetical protein